VLCDPRTRSGSGSLVGDEFRRLSESPGWRLALNVARLIRPGQLMHKLRCKRRDIRRGHFFFFIKGLGLGSLILGRVIEQNRAEQSRSEQNRSSTEQIVNSVLMIE
jgi:hypothetical protein